MFESLRCAETIKCDSALDPVRLRMARICLHYYFEQKCITIPKDPTLAKLLSQGKWLSSDVLDVILAGMYDRYDQPVNLQVSKQRQQSL